MKSPSIKHIFFFYLFLATEARLPKTSDGEGGCYDLNVHKCGCEDDYCSKEKCEAACRIWTAECPDHCDAATCSACDPSVCNGEPDCSSSNGGGDGDTVGDDSGACYDPQVHTCGCDEDRCSKEKCEGLNMVWTSECSDSCDPFECPGAIPDDSFVTDEPGLGACYDLTNHKCGCGRFECTEETCQAKGARFIWSTDCSISCDPVTCPGDFLCKGTKYLRIMKNGLSSLGD